MLTVATAATGGGGEGGSGGGGAWKEVGGGGGGGSESSVTSDCEAMTLSEEEENPRHLKLSGANRSDHFLIRWTH